VTFSGIRGLLGMPDFVEWIFRYSFGACKGKGKVIPITGPVWPRGWVEV